VFVFLSEFVVGHPDNLDTSDHEAGLFQRFALDAGEEILALLEVPAWEAPLSFIMGEELRVSVLYLRLPEQTTAGWSGTGDVTMGCGGR
jgi:hypothetical protein